MMNKLTSLIKNNISKPLVTYLAIGTLALTSINATAQKKRVLLNEYNNIEDMIHKKGANLATHKLCFSEKGDNYFLKISVFEMAHKDKVLKVEATANGELIPIKQISSKNYGYPSKKEWRKNSGMRWLGKTQTYKFPKFEESDSSLYAVTVFRTTDTLEYDLQVVDDEAKRLGKEQSPREKYRETIFKEAKEEAKKRALEEKEEVYENRTPHAYITTWPYYQKDKYRYNEFSLNVYDESPDSVDTYMILGSDTTKLESIVYLEKESGWDNEAVYKIPWDKIVEFAKETNEKFSCGALFTDKVKTYRGANVIFVVTDKEGLSSSYDIDFSPGNLFKSYTICE